MFDDMNDKEYESWKDWYDKGYHTILAGILSAFLIFVIALIFLKEFR